MPSVWPRVQSPLTLAVLSCFCCRFLAVHLSSVYWTLHVCLQLFIHISAYFLSGARRWPIKASVASPLCCVHLCFYIWSPQGNLGFVSPRSPWRQPAVCGMGTPRPAAGKAPLWLRSLNGDTPTEISQNHRGVTDDKHCTDKSATAWRVPGKALVYLTSRFSQRNHTVLTLTTLWQHTSCKEPQWQMVSVSQPEARTGWG